MASVTRTQGLDKFYTNPDVVDKCLYWLNCKWNDFDLIIEPSAGSGNFYNKIPVSFKIGIDVCPDHSDIIKKNYLEYYPDNSIKKILVLGNPPFGKNNSLSVSFFNHSAKFADTIAFIIPKTFRRNSIQNKLDLNFILISDNNIPSIPCSFTPNMSVKCCFQVWKKSTNIRSIIKNPVIHPDFIFVPYGEKNDQGIPTPPKDCDFALLAYGGKCGRIVEIDISELSAKSWHFIKSNIDKRVLINRLKSIDYSLSCNSARQNSCGKADLVLLYTNIVNSESK